MDPKLTPLQVLDDKWWVALLAFAVAIVATPVARFVAYRIKIVDRPDDLLKPHGRPVAYLGGLAICLGLLVALVVYMAVRPESAGEWEKMKSLIADGSWRGLRRLSLSRLMGISAACLLITIVGLLDDMYNISPRKKIIGQVLAAALLLVGGVGNHLINMFEWLGPLPYWLSLSMSSLMTLVLVIATCNATNLLDGLDGLCGGVTAIIAIGFLALAVFLAIYMRFPGTDDIRVVLCLAMVGAVLGFLPYNVPPASIFMGDAGSMLLGFFVATMMAEFSEEGALRWFLAAWVVFALPTLDTGLAVVRRVLSGKNIFQGDRSHLYDQLVDRGHSVKKVVLLFYCFAAVAAVIGVLCAVHLRTRYAVPLYIVLLAIVGVIFYTKGMVTPPQRCAAAAKPKETATCPTNDPPSASR